MITDDVDRLVEFYENVTLIPAVRYTPALPRFSFPDLALAIAHYQTAQLLATDNHSMIVEFLVDDVDAEYERLRTLDFDWVLTPTTMPWEPFDGLYAIPMATWSTSLRRLPRMRRPGPQTPNRRASGAANSSAPSSKTSQKQPSGTPSGRGGTGVEHDRTQQWDCCGQTRWRSRARKVVGTTAKQCAVRDRPRPLLRADEHFWSPNCWDVYWDGALRTDRSAL
jgi:hypothetical protein